MNYKYAATDPANACVTVPFILSLDAVDRTPYLLHKNMKSEDAPGKHIRVLRITFLLDYCIPVPVFHFWPKLTHPAARSLRGS